MYATDLREFVNARWHALFRTCYLLTGDPRTAQERLTRAFAATAPQIRAADRRDEDAERVVLSRVVRDTVRGGSGPTSLSESRSAMTERDSDNGEHPGGAERLWEALAAMPVRSRVAVVLEAYADLPPDDVAALLGEKLQRVGDAHALGMECIRNELAGRDAGPTADPEPVRDELARVLRERADRRPLDRAPYERVAPVLAGRRRRRVLAGGAVVLVFGLLAAGYGIATPGTPPQPTATGAVLDWPTRGSLASDSRFLDGIHHRAPDAHVLYAGDVGGTRVVLVTRVYRGGHPSLVAFEGPAGSRPQRLSTVIQGDTGLSRTSGVVAWADPQVLWSSPLVVLAVSDARTVAVSSRPRIVDGEMRRSYRTYRMRDGVFAGHVAAPTPGMMRIRVSGPNGVRYDGPVAGIERHPFYPGAKPPVPRQTYGPSVDRQAWTGAVTEFAQTHRVRYADLDVLWRWARKDGPHTDWIVTMYRLPSGAAVLQVRWWSRDLGQDVAVKDFVEGRPVADPDNPVAWQAGYVIGVLDPGHQGRAVHLYGGVPVRPLSTRTDATGFASLQMPAGVSDVAPLTISTKHRGQLTLTRWSPYDHDPLDVASADQRVDAGVGNP